MKFFTRSRPHYLAPRPPTSTGAFSLITTKNLVLPPYPVGPISPTSTGAFSLNPKKNLVPPIPSRSIASVYHRAKIITPRRRFQIIAHVYHGNLNLFTITSFLQYYINICTASTATCTKRNVSGVFLLVLFKYRQSVKEIFLNDNLRKLTRKRVRAENPCMRRNATSWSGEPNATASQTFLTEGSSRGTKTSSTPNLQIKAQPRSKGSIRKAQLFLEMEKRRES